MFKSMCFSSCPSVENSSELSRSDAQHIVHLRNQRFGRNLEVSVLFRPGLRSKLLLRHITNVVEILNMNNYHSQAITSKNPKDMFCIYHRYLAAALISYHRFRHTSGQAQQPLQT